MRKLAGPGGVALAVVLSAVMACSGGSDAGRAEVPSDERAGTADQPGTAKPPSTTDAPVAVEAPTSTTIVSSYGQTEVKVVRGGWIYRYGISGAEAGLSDRSVIVSKDITSSPPGEAQLEIRTVAPASFQDDPNVDVGWVRPDTPGRTPPPFFGRAMYQWPLTGEAAAGLAGRGLTFVSGTPCEEGRNEGGAFIQCRMGPSYEFRSDVLPEPVVDALLDSIQAQARPTVNVRFSDSYNVEDEFDRPETCGVTLLPDGEVQLRSAGEGCQVSEVG